MQNGLDVVLLVIARGLEGILRRSMVAGALGDGRTATCDSTGLALTAFGHASIRCAGGKGGVMSHRVNA